MSTLSPRTRLLHSPAFALAGLAVFLSPMNYLRAPDVYLTASDGAAFLAIVFLIHENTLPRRPFGAATSLWLSGFLLLAGGLTLGSIARGSPFDLANVLGQYGFSLILMPLALAGRPPEQTVTLLRMLVAGITAVMIFGIWMVHFVPDPPRNFVTYSGRMQSLVERENECAALGAVAIILALGLWRAGRMRLIELLLSLPILAYGIMLTGSNTGLAMAVLGILMMSVLTGSGRLLGLVALVVAALITISLLFPDMVPEVFRNRVLNGLESRDLDKAGTFSDRLLLIQEALWLSREHLLIGMGADQFRHVSSYGAPVHNTYLLLLNEGGLVSLLGLVVLMLTGLPGAFHALNKPRTRVFGAISLSIVVIYALMLNSFPHFYARFWNVPLILAITLCAWTDTAPATARPDWSEEHA